MAADANCETADEMSGRVRVASQIQASRKALRHAHILEVRTTLVIELRCGTFQNSPNSAFIHQPLYEETLF